jgi:hypothetical protein
MAMRRARRLKDGSLMVETKPGGPMVRVAPPDDFDANAYNVAAEAADPFAQAAQRRTARDLRPEDAPEREPGMVTDANLDARRPRPASIPTRAEVDETRRAVTPQAPTMDTVYVDPVEEERRRRMRAAALKGARVREGGDVHFYDPEKPVSL